METQYYRKGNIIMDTKGDKPALTAYKSVREARRASRILQAGLLGRGLVRVVDKLPNVTVIPDVPATTPA